MLQVCTISGLIVNQASGFKWFIIAVIRLHTHELTLERVLVGHYKLSMCIICVVCIQYRPARSIHKIWVSINARPPTVRVCALTVKCFEHISTPYSIALSIEHTPHMRGDRVCTTKHLCQYTHEYVRYDRASCGHRYSLYGNYIVDIHALSVLFVYVLTQEIHKRW